jgi:hypothetical protein
MDARDMALLSMGFLSSFPLFLQVLAGYQWLPSEASRVFISFKVVNSVPFRLE